MLEVGIVVVVKAMVAACVRSLVEENTADTSNNTTDDLLVALAQAAAAVAAAILGLRCKGLGCLAGGGDGCARACGGDLGSLAVDDGAEDGGVDAD